MESREGDRLMAISKEAKQGIGLFILILAALMLVDAIERM